MEEEYQLRRTFAYWRYSDAAKGFTRVDSRPWVSRRSNKISWSTVQPNGHCHYHHVCKINGKRTEVDRYAETANQESY